MTSIQLLGYIAAVATTIIYIPQAVKTIRVKHTKGVSHVTYYFAVMSSILWFSYGLALNNLPLIISNALIFCTASVTLFFLHKHR